MSPSSRRCADDCSIARTRRSRHADQRPPRPARPARDVADPGRGSRLAGHAAHAFLARDRRPLGLPACGRLLDRDGRPRGACAARRRSHLRPLRRRVEGAAPPPPGQRHQELRGRRRRGGRRGRPPHVGRTRERHHHAVEGPSAQEPHHRAAPAEPLERARPRRGDPARVAGHAASPRHAGAQQRTTRRQPLRGLARRRDESPARQSLRVRAIALLRLRRVAGTQDQGASREGRDLSG